MPQPLKVLIAEDNPADLKMVVRELRRAGFDPDWHRVDTETEFLERLHPDLDVILSDFQMPQFSGTRALEVLKDCGLDIPFIIISGTIGEDVAVAVMKQGATDYLLKDRLGRLGSAVNHAIEQSILRRSRRKVEEELRLFRSLVDQSNDIFEVIDPATGRFLDVNERGCSSVGCSREEYLSLCVWDIDPLVTESGWPEVAEKMRATGYLNREGQHRRRSDCSAYPTELNARWVRLDRDYIVAVVRDITERKKLEEQFFRAQRMESIGTLAGGIAHDLNNVLAPIFMSTSLLERKFTDAESQEQIAMISACAHRGADMVRQILSFARGFEGRRMEVQIRHLLRGIEKMANDTFLKEIEVRMHVPQDLWTVTGDPTQLHQVLMNLCVNARDAMPNGGRITISAENLILDSHYASLNAEAKPGPYVLIKVEDTGTGMSPEILAKIFDPFFTTKEIGKGTGLGLSTSLTIVKSHDGFLRVYSEPGKGTTFNVYLPAKTGQAALVAAETVPEIPHGNGELILVVDDESIVRQITKQALEAFGYRGVFASDGKEAVTIYLEHRSEIAAVLTDMMMPTMDGLTTIEVLQKINPSVRIIASSGLYANNSASLAASHGVKNFLHKPYTAETLLKTLSETLA